MACGALLELVVDLSMRLHADALARLAAATTAFRFSVST